MCLLGQRKEAQAKLLEDLREQQLQSQERAMKDRWGGSLRCIEIIVLLSVRRFVRKLCAPTMSYILVWNKQLASCMNRLLNNRKARGLFTDYY